ncbi:hypothetical protein Tco_1361325 [Tanacetum coccineum]
MQLKKLIDIVPKLVTRIETLETELQQTKTTYGKTVLTLVKRVKLLEKSLKIKTQKVVISGSEGTQEEDIRSYNLGEAAKHFPNVTSQGVARKINNGNEEISTGSTKVDSGTASKRGQREGKAPMVKEEIQATHKTKEQIRQEEAG